MALTYTYSTVNYPADRLPLILGWVKLRMKGNPWPGSLQWGWIIPTAWLYSLWNLLTWLLLIFLLLLPGRHPAAADSGRPQGSLWLLWTLQPWLWNPQPPRHPPGSGTWGRGQYLGWILGGELRRGGVVVQREWEEGRRKGGMVVAREKGGREAGRKSWCELQNEMRMITGIWKDNIWLML